MFTSGGDPHQTGTNPENVVIPLPGIRTCDPEPMSAEHNSAPNVFSFGEYFDGLRRLAEGTAGSLRQMEETLQSQQKQIVDALNALGRSFEASYPQLELACERLAVMGWTLPMQVTPRTLVSIADQGYSDQDIERILADFYTDNDCEQLRVIERELGRAKMLATRRLLLLEAFCAFYHGNYQIPVPALVSTIEGVIATESGNLPTRSTSVKVLVADREARAAPRSLERLIWYSARRWVEQVFVSADFSGPKPARLNRHWILHGRDAGPWEKADSVRLFTALHMMT
jgi:hypothetical protein